LATFLKEMSKVHFVAPESRFHPSFWERLYENVLEKYRIVDMSFIAKEGDMDAVTKCISRIRSGIMPIINVPLSCSGGDVDRSGSEFFEFTGSSFDAKNDESNRNFFHFGHMYLTNTIEVVVQSNVCIFS